jgi:hypothetical protein
MNNPIVKLLVVVALVLGGGYYGMNLYKAKVAEYDHRLDLERIRREYLERAPLARDIPEANKYAEEMRALFKWYFGELTEHYNKFGAFKNYDRVMQEFEARKKNKKLSEKEFEQYEERFKLAKGMWDALKEGRYDPIFTSAERGLRFDIYKVEALPDSKDPKVRLWVALYGAQRKWNVDTSGGFKVSKLNVNAHFQGLILQGFTAKDKQVVEQAVSGEPFKIDHPERWIEEFPPSMVFAHYDLPLLPYDVEVEAGKPAQTVERAEFAFTVSTRSVVSGEEVLVAFTWKTPLKPEWKLPPGKKWEGATEEIRSEPEGEEPRPNKSAHR